MKKNPCLHTLTILLLLVFCSPIFVNAQESTKNKKHDFWNRVSVGGNLSLQFGSVTAINVSPEIMIRTVDQLYVGVGFSYEYLQANNYFLNTSTGEYLDYKSNVYGGRIFLRYYLRSLLDNFLGNLFAHTEYEYLAYTRPYQQVPYPTDITDFYYYYIPGTEVIEVNSLFVGGGYDQPLGGKVFMSILILYNLNQTYNSPYSNPIIRLGIGVGL